jgi:hypothetical protein
MGTMGDVHKQPQDIVRFTAFGQRHVTIDILQLFVNIS